MVVALAVVAFVVVCSVMAVLVTLRTSQRDQLDKQLFAATRELLARSGHAAESSGTSSRLPDLSGADLAGGGTVGSGSRVLPRVEPAVVEAHATEGSAPLRPFDVAADGEHYRMTAVRVAGGRTVVTALSTERIEATFRRVAAGSAIAGLTVIAAMAAVAWWVERLGLRPIGRVAAAADAIASGDTARRVDPAPPGTEAGNLARAFNVMVDERQAFEERLRRFVADASHELRTPLTTVAGVLELVQSGSLAGPELDDAVRRARSESQRMTSLVEDLLLLTQLDHGLPLADDEVDLAVLVRDAAVDVGVVQPDRPVTVVVPEVAIVRGDEARLRQVIGNLVGNVLTHTPPSAAIHLALHGRPEAFSLEVRDTGPGLSAEQVKHVFDRFYRVAAGRSRRAGGTGLGLSIVQSVVAAHRGQVSVTAEPGEGCTFRVVLPREFQQTSRIPSEHGKAGQAPSRHGHSTHDDRNRTTHDSGLPS
jgi:two-component system OmpR family sensor kinase